MTHHNRLSAPRCDRAEPSYSPGENGVPILDQLGVTREKVRQASARLFEPARITDGDGHERRIIGDGEADQALTTARRIAARRGHTQVRTEHVRELSRRPSRRGTNIVSIDSGSGLANATIQQRLVPVRLFYDFLIEEVCVSPTGSGQVGTRRAEGSAVTSAVWCRG